VYAPDTGPRGPVAPIFAAAAVSRDNDTILSGEKGAALKSAAPMITALRVASFFMIFLPLVSAEV
jgi:hypothetical protein